MPILRRILWPILLVSVVCLVACDDQVAPGYRIEKQAVAARYEDGTVHLRAEYRLRNTGSEPLEALRISLAAVNPGAALDMRVFVDGAQTKWASVQEDGLPALEIQFAPAWARKQRKQLTLEYSFPSGGPQRTKSFQLLPGSWSPELLPPSGILAKGGASPPQWELSVTVPKDLLVHSAGKNRGTKNRGESIEYRFRQQKAHGYAYVVAGPYRETRVEAGGFTIHFWTLRAVPAADAQSIAARLGQTLQIYREWLGPLEDDSRKVWVVEGNTARFMLAGPAGSRPGLASDMILDPALFTSAYGREQTICLADEWLAGMWLNWLARPMENSTGLAENLARHMAQALPHGCGFAAYSAANREEAVQSLRRGFDAAHRNFQQETGPLKESYRRERQGYHHRLKLLAIEERAGREALNRSLRRVLQALRGGQWTESDLRSALEGETSQDWAAFFRAWANPEKLPQD